MRTLLLLALVSSAHSTSTLLICVQEGRDLADLDADESAVSQGSDTFVAVFQGETMIGVTSFIRDSSHPVWNECFTAPTLRHTYDVTSPVSFVVADADYGSMDDVIGTACTTASSGQRWLELTGPLANDWSERGRIKVRIFLFADTSSLSSVSHLEWQTVESSDVTPVAGGSAAEATVSCPAGKTLTGCQCASGTPASSSEPGCASARIETSVEGGLEICRATALPYHRPEPLPACPPPSAYSDGEWWRSDSRAKADEPGVTCAPPGWVQPGPSPIRASARCAKLGGLGGAPPSGVDYYGEGASGGALAHDESSPPSRATYRDATEATCRSGVMTGCSLSSAAGGLGTRFEDGDGDGRPECVGYADGDAGPATAQARCVSESAFALSFVGNQAGQRTYSLPVIGHTRVGGNGLWSAASCPQPFRLSGCGCYSENENCRSAAFSRAELDPLAAAAGGAGLAAGSATGGIGDVGGGGASGHIGPDVCNVSTVVPEAYWRLGGEAHAMCVWVGAPTDLLGLDQAPASCPAGAGPTSMSDKAWLPADWRELMKVDKDAGNEARSAYKPRGGKDFGAGFFTGVACLAFVLTTLVLFRAVLRARKRRALGGAPGMQPAQRVVIQPVGGAVQPAEAVPVARAVAQQAQPAVGAGGYTAPMLPPLASASPMMSAPLVGSDSAATPDMRAIEQPTAGSRV